MPETTTSAPKTSNSAGPGRARSAGATKARATRTAGKARTATARPRGGAKGKVASVKSTAGRASARRAAAARANRNPADLVGDYAERAVLIPVGAALLARERVATSVSDTIASYSSPSKAQRQLRKFEDRGSTARTRLEREVRKTRTRVERELRERRRELDRRRARLSKEVSSRVEQTQAQLEKTQAQIEDALRARLEDGADLASRVQERVLNLV